MKEGGVSVDATIMPSDEYRAFKETLGVPAEVWSCHTAVIDGYVVEGHIPMDVISKLVDERPQVQGIALPDMPAGSPGMPGVKSETWTMWSFTGSELDKYMDY